MNYYGQLGQDKFLNEIVFEGLQNGIFVDVGAHDGESLSNTFFFEKEKGWTGVCIEPIPFIFQKLQALRTNSKCYQVAIDSKEKETQFILGKEDLEMLSVLVDHLDPSHLKRLEEKKEGQGGGTEMITVQTKRLDNILDKHNITHVNYLSIDVEGAEIGVLESIDFSKVTFDIIEIECNNDNLKPRYDAFFYTRGFLPLLVLNWDILYIHQESPFFSKFKEENLPYHLSIFTEPWKNWKTL